MRGQGLRREVGHLGAGLRRVRDGVPAEDLRGLQPARPRQQDHARPGWQCNTNLFSLSFS